VDRPARPDDGSPARLIAIMVGIVGILLLGSLAWSAVGALFSALGEAAAPLSSGRPTPTKLTGLIGTPTRASVTSATPQTATPGPVGAGTPTAVASATLRVVATGTARAGAAATPSLAETPSAAVAPTPPGAPTVSLTATLSASGRAPWILLPQPAPDSLVASGPLVIEARGRGDAAIAAIRLDLDGVPLAVSLEQRSDVIWRGFANANVGPGHHAVRATVVDEEGRTGGFRWNFDAGP
jgi:hypothetical protein